MAFNGKSSIYNMVKISGEVGERKLLGVANGNVEGERAVRGGGGCATACRCAAAIRQRTRRLRRHSMLILHVLHITLQTHVHVLAEQLVAELEAASIEKKDLLEQVSLISDQYKTLDKQLEDMKKLFESQEVLPVLPRFVSPSLCKVIPV